VSAGDLVGAFEEDCVRRLISWDFRVPALDDDGYHAPLYRIPNPSAPSDVSIYFKSKDDGGADLQLDVLQGQERSLVGEFESFGGIDVSFAGTPISSAAWEEGSVTYILMVTKQRQGASSISVLREVLRDFVGRGSRVPVEAP
jgi:hypothetical protein